PFGDGALARLKPGFGKAEVGGPIRHPRILAGDLAGIEEGQVDRPLRAGAVAGDLKAGPAVALAHVAGQIDLEEVEGDGAAAGRGEVADPVGHRLVGGAEDVGEQLDVVTGPLHLAEEVVIDRKSTRLNSSHV